MTIATTGHDGNISIIASTRHVDIDDDYNEEITCNDAESFGGIIQGHFPGLMDIASDGGIQQVSDVPLVVWNGYGFRVHLDNGASFNIVITQQDHANEREG